MKVVIFGMGISGQGASALLEKTGVQHAPLAQVPEDPQSIVRVLENYESEGYRHAVLSPGLRADGPLYTLLAERGWQWESEVTLALRHFSGRCIGVTGTNAKSTMTALIAHALQKDGVAACAAGNIGYALSEAVASERYDTLVIELSSYQLATSAPLNLDTALLMDITPDHLSWHGSWDAYVRAKARIVGDGTRTRLVASEEALRSCAEVGEALTPFRSISTTSRREDILAAVLEAHGYPTDEARRSARSASLDFQGLPLRFETIAEHDGCLLINDSKATNIASTLHALRNLKERGGPVTLFLGGQGKGEDYAELVPELGNVQRVIAFGEEGARISEALSPHLPVVEENTLAEALDDFSWRAECAHVLFSPACASFDEFASFVKRGAFFNASLGYPPSG